MADLTIIFTAAIFIVAAVLIFKVVKGVVKLALSISILAVLLLAALLGFAVMDAKDLASNFGQEPTLFLVIEDEKAVAGVSMKEGETSLVEQIDLDRHSRFLAERDRPILAEDYYKVVLVEKEFLFGLDEEKTDELNSDDLQTRNDAFNEIVGEGMLTSPLTMLKGIRSGAVVVYPEGASLKIVRLIPISPSKNIINKTKSLVENVV